MVYDIIIMALNVIAVIVASFTCQIAGTVFPASMALLAEITIFGASSAITLLDKNDGPKATSVMMSCSVTAIIFCGSRIAFPLMIFCILGVLTNAFTSRDVNYRILRIVALTAVTVSMLLLEAKGWSVYISMPAVTQYVCMGILLAQAVVAGIAHDKTTDRVEKIIEDAKMTANVDKLTGLLNRQTLGSYITELATYSGSFAVIMMDIDNFKKVNDTYGHTEGDRILQDLAKTITACKRGNDRAFRYGGEEFCLICPQTDTTGAKGVAERIRKTFNSIKYQYNGQTVNFSVSLGVSECRYGEFKDLETTIKKSDDALYEAKHNGKNRVEINRS